MENRLVQLERLGALAEMSEGISHNLNNILTGILGPAQLIEFHTQEEEVLQETRIIQTAALRAADLVKKLSVSVAGSEGDTLIPVDAVQVIREAIDSAQPRWKDEAEAKGITIDIVTDLSPVPPVQATPRELHTIFLNLIFNAIDAMPEGGTLSISSEVLEDSVQLAVVDTGIGMDEETRRRVFEPFFTTKADVGTGLGLSTVFTSITRWDGQIELQSAPGKGTSVVINLPAWEEGISEEVSQVQRSGSILVVEDEDMIRSFLVRVLERRHKVVAVESGITALELFAAGKFDVAMVDLGMPEMPGDQVSEHLRRIDPHVATVLITGWELNHDDPRRAVFDFHVKKPFDSVDKIMNIVASAIRTRDARADN
jgi:CheY-like chemotaxis protein